MPMVPQTINGSIEFHEERLAVWAEGPTAIGLQAADIVSLSVLVDQARADYQAAQVSRNAAKSQTIIQNASVAAMNETGAGFIDTIRAFAKKTGNPGVYAAADIPAPAPPTPLGVPDVPTDVTAKINNDGHVELEWKGSREGGTSFRVERSTTPVGGAQSGWTLLTTVEERAFVDSAVPQGLASAFYRIKAQRAGGTSVASEPGQVLFGTPTQGQQQASLGLAA